MQSEIIPGDFTAYEEQKRQEEIERQIKIAGIGRRYAGCTFEYIERRGVPVGMEAYYPIIKNYANNLPENIKSGTGILLQGAVGRMKTTLAAAVLLEHIHAGHRGMFITMSSLLDTIFSLKARSVAEWEQFETNLRTISLLVIDDLGSERTEGWVLTKVDSIIAERYNNCLPVIVTTNLSKTELKETYAERIIDRMRSTMIDVVFSGSSLRERAG